VRSGCGDLKGAFYVVLAFDFAEIEILVSRTGRLPVVGRPNRLKERWLSLYALTGWIDNDRLTTWGLSENSMR
jgi:hypothetical protein